MVDEVVKPKTAEEKLADAWGSNDYWDSKKEGDVIDYGNGKLTRGAGMTATYKANGDTGPGYTFNRQMSYKDVAAGNKDIAAVWKGQFGYDAEKAKLDNAPTFDYNLKNLAGASSWQVDPKTQTVAGQLEGILSKDSPLLTQARTRALQQQNANGRLNSTMAASAADSAMYDTALQIATPDARTYGDAARFNADASNQFARDENAFSRQGAMANFNLKANEWADQQSAGRTAAENALARRENQTFTSGQNDLDRQERARIADLDRTERARADADGKKFEKDEASKKRLYGARADFTTSVNALIQNKDLGEAPKQQAINSLKLNYNMIIKQAAAELGWPDDSWLIKDEQTAPATTPPEEGATRGQGENGEIFTDGKWVKMKDLASAVSPG